MTRKLILTAILALSSLCGVATDYDILATKAGRFYGYDEWASALAMYTLMLDQQPAVPSTYTHAIVSAGMMGDSNRQCALLEQALNSRVPLDSIYNGVQQLAFEQGNAPLYENFLENIGNRFGWMRRSIDSRLLEYYSWRRDGNGMVEYARRMLKGMPDDTDYLTALADGYFDLGQTDKAIETYRHIIGIDSENYHALLVLGNYYYNRSLDDRFDDEARVLSRQYLERANKIHRTPFVTGLLDTSKQE